MNAKEIILEEVTVDEYQHLEDLWGDSRTICDCCAYAVMLNPIRADNYPELMKQMAEFRNAYQICVKKHKGWEKRYVENGFSDADFEHLARLAAKNKRKWDYLNLKLKDPSSNEWELAVIEFTEHNGSIVGYKARVPKGQMRLFDIRGRRDFKFCNGLWKPE